MGPWKLFSIPKLFASSFYFHQKKLGIGPSHNISQPNKGADSEVYISAISLSLGQSKEQQKQMESCQVIPQMSKFQDMNRCIVPTISWKPWISVN